MPLTRSLMCLPITLVVLAIVLTTVVGPTPPTAAAESSTSTESGQSAESSESSGSSTDANPFGTTVGGEALDQPGVIVEPTDDEVPAVPEIPAESYLVADVDSGEVLAAKDAHAQLPPSGTLSMLTALTLLPQLDTRAEYTVRADETDLDGATLGLRPGDSYTIDDLFHGLFLGAGRDVTAALAQAGGGAEAVADQMTQHAVDTGAFDTQITVNRTNGGRTTATRIDPDQQTSAYDLALFARSGLDNEEFVDYATTTTHQFPELDRRDLGPQPPASAQPPDTGETTHVDNNNDLLLNYPGAIGVTAGDNTPTDPAIVGAADEDDRRLVVSLMGVDGPAWESAADLLDWGFAAAEGVEPAGQLVTPTDVADAFAETAGEDAADSSDREEAPADGNGDAGGPTTQTGAEPAATPSVSTQSRFVGLNLSVVMLLGLAATFVVMAGTRVYTVLRARRRTRHQRRAAHPAAGAPGG